MRRVTGEARSALLGRQVTELEAMKEHLLLAATHELNTPLHEVMGCLDALISAEGGDSLPQATRPFAQTAQSSIFRAARLVRTMTDAVQVRGCAHVDAAHALSSSRSQMLMRCWGERGRV